MNAQKFTPGPWMILIDGTCSAAWPHIISSCYDPYDSPIAELPNCFRERSRRGVPGPYSKKPQRFMQSSDYEEIMANANLIAAAPDLYQSLLEMVEDSDDVDDGKLPKISAATLTRARQVLAKAVAP